MVRATWRDDIAAEFAKAQATARLKPDRASQAFSDAIDFAMVASGATSTDQQYRAVPDAYLRKEQRAHEESLESVFESVGGQLQLGAALIVSLRSKRLVREVLKSALSDRQVTCIYGFYEGKNQREIALSAGCSQATVSRETAEAIEILRKQLPDDPYWCIVEHLLEVFRFQTLSLASRI